MSIRDNLPKVLVLAVLAGGAAVWLWRVAGPAERKAPTTVAVKVPALSAAAAQGKVAFDAVCAACHGANAAGTGKGPPLVHDIYNPGHHADAAFFAAVRRGTRQHHWPYGDMPPQPQVSPEQVEAIVRYVRELQQANGITYRPHAM